MSETKYVVKFTTQFKKDFNSWREFFRLTKKQKPSKSTKKP